MNTLLNIAKSQEVLVKPEKVKRFLLMFLSKARGKQLALATKDVVNVGRTLSYKVKDGEAFIKLGRVGITVKFKRIYAIAGPYPTVIFGPKSNPLAVLTILEPMSMAMEVLNARSK